MCYLSFFCFFSEHLFFLCPLEKGMGKRKGNQDRQRGELGFEETSEVTLLIPCVCSAVCKWMWTCCSHVSIQHSGGNEYFAQFFSIRGWCAVSFLCHSLQMAQNVRDRASKTATKRIPRCECVCVGGVLRHFLGLLWTQLLSIPCLRLLDCGVNPW